MNILRCDDYARGADALLDGDHSFFERLPYHLHALICPTCRRWTAQLRATRAWLKRQPPPAAPDASVSRAMSAFDAWKASPPPDDPSG